MRRRCRRCDGERGASLVEFALILPVFALLLFGMIDFGIVYNDMLNQRSGTREGARVAAVNTEGNFTGSCSVAAGSPALSGDTQKLVCLTKDRVGLPNNRVRVEISFPENTGPGSPATPAVGDPIQIRTQVCLSSRTGIMSPFINGKLSSSTTKIRLETDTSASAWSEGSVSC